MAEYKPVSMPGPFDFSKPQTWSTWVGRFQKWINVSGRKKADNEEKIDCLLYSMDEDGQGQRLLDTFTDLTEENKKKYDEVKKRFDKHTEAC